MGMTQSGFLSPVACLKDLFIIYINDLENGLKSSISKFDDDTKVGGKAITISDCEIIQNDHENIVQWSEKWQMPLNVDKCKVMHFGHRNCKNSYNMKGKTLKVVNESTQYSSGPPAATGKISNSWKECSDEPRKWYNYLWGLNNLRGETQAS